MGNEIKEIDALSTQSSVYRNFRILGILGCFCGDFPVKNGVMSKVSNRLSFKILSINFIWSIAALFFRITFVIVNLSSMSGLFAEDYWVYTSTDFTALAVMVGSTLSFGVIAQFLNLSQTRGLLQILQLLDVYDDKYARSSVTKLFTKRLAVCILSSCLIVIFPALIVLQETPKEAIGRFLHGGKSPGGGGGGQKNEIHLTLIPRIVFIMSFVEYGSLFYYAVLFYTSRLYKDRLHDILQMLKDKCAKKSFGLHSSKEDSIFRRLDKAELMKKSFLGMGRVTGKSWRALAEQYLDFCDVYELFEGFVGQYFIVLFLTLIISLICVVYVVSNIKSMFVSETTPILIGVTCFSFARVLFLCNVGEEFEGTQREMMKILGRLQQDTFWPEEKQEFESFVKLIKTIPIRLSASGFFMVNRKNATSILSVIITYIIVLIQFKMSSKERVFNNSTTSALFLNLTLEESEM